MSEKTIRITAKDAKYRIQNAGLSEFETIGILECVLFELKTSTGRREERVPSAVEEAAPVEDAKPESDNNRNKEIPGAPAAEPAVQETVQEKHREQVAPGIRLRISNAVKAIRSLGGEASQTDLSAATDEELQAELEELKNQYKRLKSSHKPK